jgi:hypothetical protein
MGSGIDVCAYLVKPHSQEGKGEEADNYYAQGNQFHS